MLSVLAVSSVNGLQNVLEGGEFVTLSNKLCDIRDGARAHILAAERPEAEVRRRKKQSPSPNCGSSGMLISFERMVPSQGRYIVALKETVDHKFVTDLLQKRFPEYEIYTGKTGPCVDLIDISRVCTAPRLHSAAEPCPHAWAESARLAADNKGIGDVDVPTGGDDH